MAAKRPTTKPDPASELREKFEDFAKAMTDEPVRASIPMGGMERTAWSGIPMWRCPRCSGTTFNEADSKVHTCQQSKFATSEDIAST